MKYSKGGNSKNCNSKYSATFNNQEDDLINSRQKKTDRILSERNFETKSVPTKLGVHIQCADIYKSLNFYRNLGFKPVFAYGRTDFLNQFPTDMATAPENYNGVSFGIGNAVLELAEAHVAVKPEVFQEKIESSKVSLFIDVNSLKIFQKRCFQRDIKISVPARHFHWGSTELVVKDPDGLILVFRELD